MSNLGERKRSAHCTWKCGVKISIALRLSLDNDHIRLSDQSHVNTSLKGWVGRTLHCEGL
eukprot:751082-Hanusia_phi.AAC.2